MRKEHLTLTTLSASLIGMFAVFLAACAPSETQSSSPKTAPPTSINVESTATPVVDLTATRVDMDGLDSASPAPTPQMVATSRGPHLEATDPTTVSMASGDLQFVEFFEFW